MKKIILLIVLLSTLTSYSQITVRLHFSGNEQMIKTASDSLNFAYVKLGRMNKVYDIFITDRETFKPIRRKLKKNPNITILGAWNAQGKRLNLPDADDTYTRAKLKQRMKRYIRRNSNGDIEEDRELTDEEIDRDPFNRIYGQPKKEY